jgi:MFS family permease
MFIFNETIPIRFVLFLAAYFTLIGLVHTDWLSARMNRSTSRNESPTHPAVSGPKAYRVGSLVYTPAALLTVMFWMLLGDLCLQIMEQLPTSLVPLQLRWATASDTLIGFVSGSLPAVLGILLNPVIGIQSDRHRGKLGRRRPFLLWSMPLVLVALLGLGFAKPVAAWLGGWTGAQSPAAVEIGWIGGCMVLFVVANTYIMQIYQFLFVDVIPKEVMGRFVGCYRAVGALGAFVFHRFMFGHAEARTGLIYVIAAVLYCVSFSLLIWKVKEGEYGPPPPKQSFTKTAASYLTECFRNPFYLKVYSLAFCFWSSIVPFWTFLVFFGTKPGQDLGYAPTLGLSLESFGQVRGWCSLVQVPVFFLVGPLVDRFHPLRLGMVGMLLSSLTFFANFAFVHDKSTFTFWLITNFIAQAIYMGAYLAILPRLLPRQKYGQFFTANQIFGFAGVVIAPVLCGHLLETMKDYRFIHVWCGSCTLVGFFMSVVLYCHWRKLGGDAGYQPPGVNNDPENTISSL